MSSNRGHLVVLSGNHKPASLWLRLFVPVALVAFIGLVFVPALDAGLVDWDDDDLLVYNARYRTLDADSLRWMFSTSLGGHFQPLAWITFAVDWAVWKREMFGYHLTNVLLHALTAVAFYFVTRRLLSLAHPDRDSEGSGTVLGAGLAAALFAVHPLRVESVAWLAERRDVLSGLFYVLAVAWYLRYAAADRASDAFRHKTRVRIWAYVAAVAACLLSLLAKASAVTLPLVLVILDAYPLCRWRPRVILGRARWRTSADHGLGPAPGDQEIGATAGAPGGSGVDHPHFGPRVWLEKLPFFALALAAGVRALMAQADAGAMHGLSSHGVLPRLAQACYGLTFYVWKTIWPADLGPLYEIPPREVLLGRLWRISLAAILIGGWAVFRLRRRVPALLAAVAVYAVILLPVLGFVQSGPQLVADRYSYLSCMGFAVLAGGALVRLAGSSWCRRVPAGGWVLAIPCVALITTMGRATFAQADNWLSAYTLWTRGVAVSPNSSIAHTNLADALLPRGEYREAAWHYRRAIELNPRDSVALHHFADLLRWAGQTQQAIQLYLRSLRVAPDRPRACLSLAQLLVEAGRPHDALLALKDGARRNPDALDLIDYLAQLLCTHPDGGIRDGPEAVRWALHVSQAQRFQDPPSLLTLATAYAEAGRFDEAMATAAQALALARENGDQRLVGELNRRAGLFRQGRPYRVGQ